MKWSMRLFVVCVMLLTFCFSTSVAFAEEDTESAASSAVSSSESSIESGFDEGVSDDDSVSEASYSVYDSDNPLPVIVVDEEPSYSVLAGSGDSAVVSIGDTPPDTLLFNGAGWITGTDSNLGRVTLYFPINYKSGYWGVDSNGYLYNVSSSSISGYLNAVYNNSVSASGFSYPRYRTGSSGYDYITLQLVPEESNMQIATGNTPLYTFDDFYPYLLFFIGGVLFLCFMKRS